MIITDSITRLLDNAIKEESYEGDSFMDGLLEYPQYTRPVEYNGKRVPDVLLSGNHALINRFRRKESLRRTMERRPDLIKKANLSKEDLKLIEEIREETK